MSYFFINLFLEKNWTAKFVGWFSVLEFDFKGDSNPNNKYVLLERAICTMSFDTNIIKIGWKMDKLWAFKEFNMANI